MKKLTRINLDSLAARLPVLDEQEQRAILGGNSGASTGSYTGGIDSGIISTGNYSDPTGSYGDTTGSYGGTGAITPPTGTYVTGLYLMQVTGAYGEDSTFQQSPSFTIAIPYQAYWSNGQAQGAADDSSSS